MLRAVKNREQSSARIQDMSSSKNVVPKDLPKRTPDRLDKGLIEKAVRQQKLSAVQQKLADRERVLEARKKAATEEKLRKRKQAKPVLPPGPVERNSVVKSSLAYERALLLLGKKKSPTPSGINSSKEIGHSTSSRPNKNVLPVERPSCCVSKRESQGADHPQPSKRPKLSANERRPSELLSFNQLMEMAQQNTNRTTADLEDSMKAVR
uniref:Uncharacterized protein n=1 Tax=Trichuris muris TaxID=70415 RepID=A0A5S6QW79_TRIMR